MSFILDAIAKSEHERQQQEIPDARILATPGGELYRPRPRRMSLYLMVGILLLIVILLLIWRQADWFPFNRFSQTVDSSMEDAAVRQNKVTSEIGTSYLEKATSAAVLNRSAEISRAKTTTPNPAAQSADSTDFNKSLEAIKVDSLPRIENTQAGSIDNLDSNSSQKKAQNIDGGRNISNTNTPLISQDVIKDADEVKPANSQNSGEPESRRIFRLSDLPVDVRRDLPAVSFSGHLYSKKLNVSYVMVNGGQSVTAGQLIANDLFLHEVTPTGAIVDFRGFLIEVGILQNWSLK